MDGVNSAGIRSPLLATPDQRDLMKTNENDNKDTNEATWANRTHIENIIESYGPCSRYNRCKTVGTLGNGLCQGCWDRGMYRGGRGRRAAK